MCPELDLALGDVHERLFERGLLRRQASDAIAQAVGPRAALLVGDVGLILEDLIQLRPVVVALEQSAGRQGTLLNAPMAGGDLLVGWVPLRTQEQFPPTFRVGAAIAGALVFVFYFGFKESKPAWLPSGAGREDG